MINYNAIERFNNHYAHFDLVANQHNTAFNNNVVRYLELKNLLHNVDVSQDEYFQSRFTFFYGLHHIPSARRSMYYQEMEALKNSTDPINVRALTERLEASLGKKHFSFCSKMANIINDNAYPIFDSHIAAVFHRPGLGYGIDYKDNMYQDVIDTYNSLRDSPTIATFRNMYNAGNMGYMKVLDTLFWVL